jgi:flagellar hook-basal body complex protein FliE
MYTIPTIGINSAKPFPLTPIGDNVKVKTLNDLHYSDKAGYQSPDNVAESFAETLKKSLEKVNDLEVGSEELTQKLVYDPNSVDVHEVMIAAEKARMAITLTKTITDGVIRAYRELSNLR